MENLQLLMLTIAVSILLVSCDKDDKPVEDNTDDVVFAGNQIGNGEQEFEIKSSYTLKKGTYLLKGWVYVTDGATLTIEPGTVIKGDKETKAALIVERGGRIMAEGTKTQPIVFTSNQGAGLRKPGDWGGVIICGRATNNKTEMIIEGGPRSSHGGTQDSDNSGILSYVRIEFAGYPFKTDQEINGLTLGSVGSGTRIDHIQVSYSNDDSFEWFGGMVDAKYLIAYHGWDDDFDTDNGYRGKIQYGLIVRNPRIADKSSSNGLESDNNAEGTTQQPVTKPVFSNITFIGPAAQDNLFENTTAYITGGNYYPGNGSKLGQFQSAIQIRRSSNLNCYNSVAVGYPVGLLICNDKGSLTQSSATSGTINLKNNVFAGMGILGSDKDASFKDSLSINASTFDKSAKESFSSAYFKNSGNSNIVYPLYTAVMLSQPSSLVSSPNWGPLTGSPLTGKSNLFVDENLSSSFFDKVTFIGAFRSSVSADDWTAGWANFNPQYTAY